MRQDAVRHPLTRCVRHLPALVATCLLGLAACSGGDSGEEGPTEPPEATLEIVTQNVGEGTVGTAYARTFSATGGGGTYQWSVEAGSLPPGLSLQGNGSLSGTPTIGGDFGFTIAVVSGGQRASRAFVLNVAWPTLVITTGGLPSASLGAPYSAQLVAVGGDGSYAWSLEEGTLPAGLALAADGAIGGVPAEVGPRTFTVAVTSVDDTATTTLDLDVGAPEVTVQTASLGNGVVGQSYAETLTATGGDGEFEWTVESGALPAGVALATDGTISGTPTTVGRAEFVVHASSAGQVGTRALSIGIAATVDATPASVTGTIPSVLIEGENAVIQGSGFASTPGDNTLRIAGRPVTITAATETSLDIVVPAFECLPPRAEPLQLVVGGLATDVEVDVSPYRAGAADLAAGFYTYTLAGDGCIQLPQDVAGAEYMIGVTSVSESPASVTPIRVRVTPGDVDVFTSPPPATSGPLAPDPAGRRVVRLTDTPLRSAEYGLRDAAFRGSVSPDRVAAATGPDMVDRRDRDSRAHIRMLEASERLIDRLGRPDHPARAGGPAGSPAAVAVVGDTLELSIFPEEGGSCTTRPSVRAVARYVGDNAVWLEDVASPEGTFTAQEFAILDAFYTDNVQTVHDAYFGTLSDVDGNGRVLVLMSPKVNERGVLGYVWSGDFFPQSSCGSSNVAEIFYGIVPDSAGSVGNARSRQEVLELYPELMTHEITHVVQLGERVFGTAGSKTIWETEGGATFSEQIVALPLFGNAQGDELGFEEWSAGVQWYIEWANGLAFHFGFQGQENAQVEGAPEQCTWLGNEDQGNTGPCVAKVRAPYDVPSFFFRALLDRFGPTYPGGEAAMMKRLTLSPFRGWDAIGDVTGRPIEEDLAEFYITLWGDGLIGDLPMLTTWDLFDVFSELVPEARLRPDRATSAGVDTTASVRGGSNYYLYWTPDGAVAPTSVRVTGPSGSSTPGTVSVWVLRVR